MLIKGFLLFLEVCYIRLDFESFNLLGPSTTDEATNAGGACARDAFKVTVSEQKACYFILYNKPIPDIKPRKALESLSKSSCSSQ
jgi:hypothetical protein